MQGELNAQADFAQIQMEVNDYEGDAPQIDEAGAPIAPRQKNEWSEYTPLAMQIITSNICPNWNITDDEKAQLSEAIADVLQELFPGGLGNIDEWGVYAKLAFVVGSVGLTRFDFETGKFLPMRVLDVPKQEAATDGDDEKEND